MNERDFERREKARQDAMFDAQFADEPTSDVEYADETPCKTGSQCTNKCQRCGEINPAEIHTCSPNYVDRRQWKYDPMTGEPLVNGWPLYSGLPPPPQRQQRTYTLRKWVGLTDEEAEQIVDAHWNDPSMFIEAIENKLKEKNNG